MIKCPVRKRLIKKNRFLLKRSLPSGGEILVKEKERIRKEQIVATANFSPGFRFLDLAAGLKVKPPEAKKYFKKKPGDRVFYGEIIAEQRSFFGGKKELSSPFSGTIAGFDEKTGVLKINFSSQPVKIAAGADGKIVKIEKETITIEAVCDKLSGVAGAGRGEGLLKPIVPPGDFFLPSFINHDLAGTIVAGGSIILRDTLEKAVTLGVAGIICGGMHYRDFLALAEENKDFAVVILEGFGPFSPQPEIWEFLCSHENHYGFIEDNEVFIPLDVSLGEGLKLENEENKEIVLKKGERIRIVAEPYFAKTGTVVDIAAEEETMASGLTSIMVEVNLSEEEKKIVKVPWQNLEILEESC